MSCSAASSATLSNQMFSLGLSRWVTTSATSTPCASNTERQRTPTLWYAKTTARLIRSISSTERQPLPASPCQGRSIALPLTRGSWRGFGVYSFLGIRKQRRMRRVIGRFGLFLSGFRCDDKRIDLSRDSISLRTLHPLPFALHRLFQHRFDQIARPMAHLLVDAPDVFAEQTDAEQRDTDQEEHQCEQREQALCFRADHQAAHHEEYEEQAGEHRDQHPQHGEHLQRHQREAGHQVEVQADQAVQRILRFARRAFLMPDDHL